MEEHVLSQMLSGQKSVRTERTRERIPESPPTTRMRRRSATSWTPAPTELLNGGLSPVTPARVHAPTSTDVSLAEMTSAVVIAAERDKRQRDAIRRLAHQNECLERENRDLQAAGRRERRRSSNTSSSSNKDVDAELERELNNLRREKRDWQKRDKARRKEERIMADKFEDITQSAKRVLSERDSHLRTIAALSQELHELRTGTGSAGVRAVVTASLPLRRPSIPAPPAFSETSQSPRSTRHRYEQHHRQFDMPDAGTPRLDRESHGGKQTDHTDRDAVSTPRDALNATPRSTQSERVTRTKTHVPSTRIGGDSLPLPSTTHENTIRSVDSAHSVHGAQGVHTTHSARSVHGEGASRSHSQSRGSEQEVTETQRALHYELNELADENRKLRAENRELKFEVRNSAAEREPRGVEQALADVDEELGMLETVVNAMDLSITTDEAKDKQETMTRIEQTLPHTSVPSGASAGVLSVRDLAQRLGNVRKMIAEKYGQYLRDFFTTDESLTLPQGATLQPMPDDTMVSLPTTATRIGNEHQLLRTRQFPSVDARTSPTLEQVGSTEYVNAHTSSAQPHLLGPARSVEQTNGFSDVHAAVISDSAPAETALVVYSGAANVHTWPDGLDEHGHVEQ